MKYLCFELSMPSNNSWNGTWSGNGTLYCIVKGFSNKSKITPKLGSYFYEFGDGWTACINVREVTSSAAEKLKKESCGFCGYDWMVNSIICYGDIKRPGVRQEEINIKPLTPPRA